MGSQDIRILDKTIFSLKNELYHPGIRSQETMMSTELSSTIQRIENLEREQYLESCVSASFLSFQNPYQYHDLSALNVSKARLTDPVHVEKYANFNPELVLELILTFISKGNVPTKTDMEIFLVAVDTTSKFDLANKVAWYLMQNCDIWQVSLSVVDLHRLYCKIIKIMLDNSALNHVNQILSHMRILSLIPNSFLQSRLKKSLLET